MILVLLELILMQSCWSIEINNEDMIVDTGIQQSAEPLETNPNKFSDLVKSTMDLMGPESEISQVTEQKLFSSLELAE